ncbi:short transient receptor potential channel 4-like [Pocillopora verrucosa]|uniref:short transient receptor potential channel 4-like n=1 Tax=Pocillopora verrucosa TaxID=203993 RepID=UPI0033404DE4
MAQDVSTENVHLQQEGGAEDVYSPLRDILEREDENNLANQLFRALGENDAFPRCWKLLEENHHAIRLEYENFQNNCKEASKKEQQREERFHCSSKCSEEPKEEQQSSEPQGSQKECINGETKLNWIKVLSNPLFLGLEWLWRTKSNCPCTFCEKDRKLVGKEKKKKEDVIASSLRDAYLLDETSSLKHYNSRDVYRESAEAYETFAAGILEKASQKELHEIMDIKGEGCLLQNDSHQQRNFIESLSLLKSAVNKRRKKFVSSPRCQAILDEVIFYEMRDWQDKSMAKKFFRCLCQFFVVLLVTPLFYVFIRPPMKIWRSLSDIECLAYVEKLYEYPYNKFANHTMFYIVFLCLLFASTFGFEHEYRTSTTGLSSIDYAVLVYFIGFLLQEIWEVCQQGFCIYISKWWNVVDAMTLFTLLAAYTVWLVTWLSVYKEWQPRKNAFIVADVLYASATVLAFFHLAHAFQVSSTLGPLQLSLYRMLKDVAKFLFIFLMLFIAFATGLIKIYSYYVVSQVKLREEGESKFQDFHPYAEHEITFIGLVWLLVGYVEEDKIRVDDPAFYLTQLFGRLGFLIYLVCTVIVALNMLIAMMNNSCDRVMVGLKLWFVTDFDLI